MTGPIYCNEFDPRTAAWLRQLMADGHLPKGEVNERSIEDVVPDELRRFRECHFFAGIGGWPLALRMAGWPEERTVWTGSCPCQPFSTAGKGKGFADERHLWPSWFHLIDQLRPDTVFGEQVADGDGEKWFDLVSADLEGIGYAVGMAVLPAAGFGAPHGRHRIFFVADAERGPAKRYRLKVGGASERVQGPSSKRQRVRHDAGHGVPVGDLAHGKSSRHKRREHSGALGEEAGERSRVLGTCGHGSAGLVVNPVGPGLEGHAGDGDDGREPGRVGSDPPRPVAEAGNTRLMADADGPGQHPSRWRIRDERHDAGRGGESGTMDDGGRPGPLNGYWRDADWLFCRDGLWRSVRPGSFPLGNGIPARVVRIRGYGNAIVPAVAASFIRAFLESRMTPPR